MRISDWSSDVCSSDLLSNDVLATPGLAQASTGTGLERVADVPIYRSDVLVRRSQPLQETAASQPPKARMAASTLAGLGVVSGDALRITGAQGQEIGRASCRERVCQ